MLALLRIERERSPAVRIQLYEQVRAHILGGRIAGGTALPSSREIALKFGLSRSTVTEAIEMLAADGLVVSKRGSGTFAAKRAEVGAQVAAGSAWAELSSTAHRLRIDSENSDHQMALERCFMPALPSLDDFPSAVWSQMTAHVLRSERAALLSYDTDGGHAGLRESLAAQARLRLGIACGTEQIVIVNGIQQAWDILARLLVDHGDTVWVEEPGEPTVTSAMIASGARVVPIPVDESGMQVQAAPIELPPRVIHVTPVQHWPLGAPLSAGRRATLLQVARTHDAYIIESSFNTEFRFSDTAPSALATEDIQRVIHVSSFSLTVFPALRLGYMIVPPALVEPVLIAKRVMHRDSGVLQQAVLSRFIAEGYYGEYVRTSLEMYRARRNALMQALDRAAIDGMSVKFLNHGLHAVATLSGPANLNSLVRKAAQRDVMIWPATKYYRLRRPGIAQALLGFGCVDEAAIEAGVRVVRDCLGAQA